MLTECFISRMLCFFKSHLNEVIEDTQSFVLEGCKITNDYLFDMTDLEVSSFLLSSSQMRALLGPSVSLLSG